MRAIKFRAWNKKKNKMTKHFGYGKTYMSGGDGISINELIKAEQAYNMIIMQYTGLKDKNGKEIYEGDIVAVDEKTGQIVFKCGTYKVRRNGINYPLEYLFQEFKEVEVIGNIYENPELKETS